MKNLISFPDFVDFLKLTVEKKNIAQDEDQLILCCGYEGTGKSTLTLAIYCLLCDLRGLTPRKELIFYEWREYLMRNLYAMIDTLKTSPQDMVQEVMDELGMSADDIKVPEGMYLPQPGDVLCYDEAGTQAYNRDAMSKKNVNQSKLLISNRFLNLVHIWNVPHPGSIDIYAREQRTKIMILVDSVYNKDLTQKIRNVFVYGKDSYTDILNRPYWKNEIKKPRLLASLVPPDMIINLPNNLPDYIPKEIQKYYLTKKKVFNIRQVLAMKADIDGSDDDGVKVEKNFKELMVQPGEHVLDWVSRTNLNPNYYTNYGGSRRNK